MEEREETFEVSYKQVLPKLILILVFFAGTIIFGKMVWKIEFNQTWKRWAALVFGEFAYLYSFGFIIAGITMLVVRFKDEEEDNGFGVRGMVIILCLAAIFQLVFWGIVCANYELFKIAAVLAVIVVVMGVWLKLTSK